MLQIRGVVPSVAKIELRNLRTLAEAWKYLDGEYGHKDRLTVERVEYLHGFQCSGQAKTDVACFKELHGVWQEVYTDLDKIQATANLDNALCIKMFIAKFPIEVQQSYVRSRHRRVLLLSP